MEMVPVLHDFTRAIRLDFNNTAAVVEVLETQTFGTDIKQKALDLRVFHLLILS